MAAPVLFVLGKPASRTPVIDAVVRTLTGHGPVRTVVPKPATAGHWRVRDGTTAVADVVGERGLIVQRGLSPGVLAELTPWRDRCCNDPVASAAVHDRVQVMRGLEAAGIPVPAWSVVQHYPAGRGQDMVVKAVDARAGRGRTVQMPGQHGPQPPFPGPYLVQEAIAGWEAKVYLLGDRVAAARRGPGQHTGGDPFDPGPDLADLARRVGQACGLAVCGVDAIMGGDGPKVIDVNPFPSAAKIPGAAAILAAYLHARADAIEE